MRKKLAVNIADDLFERSRGVACRWPKKLAEVFHQLIWTMDDNGAEIMVAVERWLQSDDLDRVRVALEVTEVFPFRHQSEMDAVLSIVKARWPELTDQCHHLSATRAKCTGTIDPIPLDVAQRVKRLQELLQQMLSLR